jgi:hypothetical protein
MFSMEVGLTTLESKSASANSDAVGSLK